MPSLFTLEGNFGQRPTLGYASAQPVTAPVYLRDAAPTPTWYGFVGLAAVALAGWWAYGRYKRTGALFGPDMLSTIAVEAKSRAEYARRAEAWNASNAKALSVEQLARRYRRGNTAETARLIRAARRARVHGRDQMFQKLARGLKGRR